MSHNPVAFGTDAPEPYFVDVSARQVSCLQIKFARHPANCFVPGVDIGNVTLLVAALDLKLVQDIRGAIRKADATGAKTASHEPVATYEPRRTIHPEPVYQARRVIHPMPHIDTRHVEHLTKINPDSIPATSESKPVHHAKSPLDPPWKTLPWKNPPRPGHIVKVFQYRPDMPSSGSILDCFL